MAATVASGTVRCPWNASSPTKRCRLESGPSSATADCTGDVATTADAEAAALQSMRPSTARINRHSGRRIRNEKKRTAAELDELTHDCERIMKRMTLGRSAGSSGKSSVNVCSSEEGTAESGAKSPTGIDTGQRQTPWSVSNMLVALPKRTGKRQPEAHETGPFRRRMQVNSIVFGGGGSDNSTAAAAGCRSPYVDRPTPIPLRFGSAALIPYAGGHYKQQQKPRGTEERPGFVSPLHRTRAQRRWGSGSDRTQTVGVHTDMPCVFLSGMSGCDVDDDDEGAVVDKGVRIHMKATGEYSGGIAGNSEDDSDSDCSESSAPSLRTCWIEDMAPDEVL